MLTGNLSDLVDSIQKGMEETQKEISKDVTEVVASQKKKIIRILKKGKPFSTELPCGWRLTILGRNNIRLEPCSERIVV